ncbi:Fic/DOC family N-terminal domain-containing protein [Tistrella bauzanensis]|uniref:Fic/DOC family N-terminal domain-containing protein n=1 Tax=Tistrella TaxID=171436 RepID=UPI0031F6C9EE
MRVTTIVQAARCDSLAIECGGRAGVVSHTVPTNGVVSQISGKMIHNMDDPRSPAGYDLSDAVDYHYDRFPPTIRDYGVLNKPIAQASAALARYDQMLKGMRSSEILLAPMRSQEAVISSRMEGTISTLDEVLRLEAEQEDEGDGDVTHAKARSEAIEVWLYSRAMKQAQAQMKDGVPLSNWLIRSSHQILLNFGRGAHLSPGVFKIE